MSIDEIQQKVGQLEQKEWPDYRIDEARCELYAFGGTWVIEVQEKVPEGTDPQKQFVHVLTAKLSVYRFSWPVPHADSEAAFQAAMSYMPQHPEVNGDRSQH